jgi:hypothetical protein
VCVGWGGVVGWGVGGIFVRNVGVQNTQIIHSEWLATYIFSVH